MKRSISIYDESMTGNVINEIRLDLDDEKVTVKDLIQSRIYQEVEAFNNRPAAYFKGLVQPEQAEATMLGFKLKRLNKIDPEEQFYIALHAFQKNGFFILINNCQVESLEVEVPLRQDTRISFVKLTPLVGG